MKKHYNIEFLRFAFSVIIVYFHILHSNIMPYTDGHGTYIDLQQMCRMAYTLVEAFLIIGGYFIYTSWVKTPNKPFAEFALHRFFRIWPVFAFYMICFTLMKGDITENTLLDVALLRATGLSLTFTEIVWYVAPFFWSSLLMFAILKTAKKQSAGLIIALISYFGYLINLNYMDGGAGAAVIWNSISLAMLRVMAGLGIGILIGMAMSELSAVYQIETPPRGRLAVFLFSLTEAICGGLLLCIVLFRRPHINNIFSVVVIFSVLFVCFINHLGIFSRLLNKPIFACMGRYSYSIYVMQQISFDIMEETIWQNTDLICNYELITILLSVAFSVFVGVVTYYLVERPTYSFFKKWEMDHKRVRNIVN